MIAHLEKMKSCAICNKLDSNQTNIRLSPFKCKTNKSKTVVRRSLLQAFKERKTEKLSCILGQQNTFAIHEKCLHIPLSDNLPDICPFGVHLKNCKKFNCTNTSKCPNSYCIPYRHVCDGVWNCPNGEDEDMNCTDLQCPGYIHCEGMSVCLHPSELCDGKVHCSHTYQDDESICIENYICVSQCFCLGTGIFCKEGNFQIVSLIGITQFEFFSGK